MSDLLSHFPRVLFGLYTIPLQVSEIGANIESNPRTWTTNECRDNALVDKDIGVIAPLTPGQEEPTGASMLTHQMFTDVRLDSGWIGSLLVESTLPLDTLVAQIRPTDATVSRMFIVTGESRWPYDADLGEALSVWMLQERRA